MARAIVVGLGIAGGVLLFLLALGLTGLALNALRLALDAGNVAFILGALLVIAWAIASVTLAGANLLKGLPFHLMGVVGPYLVGALFMPFERLRVAGGVIYIAAWSWTYLGETIVRLVRARTRG
ncbi:MAG: hypothetical protein HY688_05125 [Chloroflexi bacterium]|nr:hypothetical protein [Chloroflexota bacterium]